MSWLLQTGACRHLFSSLSLSPLDKYPEAGFLDHVIVLFKFLEEASHYFPQWQNQFTCPLTVHNGFLFSTSSQTLVITCLFYNSHLPKMIELFFFSSITVNAGL